MNDHGLIQNVVRAQRLNTQPTPTTTQNTSKLTMSNKWTDLPSEIRSHILHHLIHEHIWPEALKHRSPHDSASICKPQLLALTQVSYTFGLDCLQPLLQVKIELDRDRGSKRLPSLWKDLWNDSPVSYNLVRMVKIDTFWSWFCYAPVKIEEREVRLSWCLLLISFGSKTPSCGHDA